MFSSNQTLEISGDIRHENDLRDALEFALKKSGYYERFERTEHPLKCVFQTTKYGGYCLGRCISGDNPKDGWAEFQFDFDLNIIAKIIEQHLSKCKVDECGGDGSNSKGYLLKRLEYNETDVKEPSCRIIIIYPYNCYYAK